MRTSERLHATPHPLNFFIIYTIPASLSAEDFAATKTELQKVSQSLSFLVKLTQDDTEAMYSVGDADKTFMRNCLAEMNGAADLLPSYLKSEKVGSKGIRFPSMGSELASMAVRLPSNGIWYSTSKIAYLLLRNRYTQDCPPPALRPSPSKGRAVKFFPGIGRIGDFILYYKHESSRIFGSF